MPPLSEMNLGSQVAKTIVARAFLAAFGFAGTIIFARVLGPMGFGGYYLLYSVIQIADRPFRGWTSGIEKRYSEHDALHGEILGSAVLFNLVGFGVIAPVVLLLEPRLASFTGIEGPAVLFLVLLGTIVCFQPLDQLVAAEGRVALANYVDGFRSVVTLGLQLLLVSIGLGVAGMVYGLAGATAVAIAVNLYIIGRLPSLPSLDLLRSIAEFARYAIPTSIIGQTYNRFDILLLGAVLTPAVAGEYEVAMKLTVPAVFVSNSIRQAMFPKVSNLHSKGEKIAADIANSKAFTSILAVPIFFGAVALSERVVVTIYGPEYRTAGLLLIGLALYRIVNTQAQIHIRTLEAVDRPRSVFHISIISLAINLPLGYALTVTYGAIGVVIATVLVETLRYVLLVLSTQQIVDIGFVSGELLRQLTAGAIMFVAVWKMKPLVTEWSWIVLITVVSFGAGVYFTALVALSRKLRVTVRDILVDIAGERTADR